MGPNAGTKNMDKGGTDLELFRDLINKTNDAIFVSGPQAGRFIFVNDKACTLLGYNRQELLKLNFKDIETTFPDNFSCQTPVDELRQKGSHMLEGIAKQKNGATFPVEVNLSYVTLNTREYAVAVVRDITERKRSEAILRQSIEKYSAFYNETPIMLHSIDHTGTIVKVNNHWLNTLGYERNEVLGRKVTDFYTEASRKYAVEVVQPAFFQDGFCKNVEYQLVKKNGEVMDVLLSATGERDADGHVVLSHAVIENITERKRVEAALRNSEIMLRTIIETEPECVKLLDANANLLMMNRAGLEMLQVDSLDQVKGQCVCPMIVPEYCDSFMDLTKRIFNGESGTLVFKMTGVKGRQLWLETHAVPFRNEKNEIVALLGVTRDITERKMAEQAAEQAAKEWSAAMDVSEDIIYLLDVERHLIRANKAFYTITGKTPEISVGHHIADILHPDKTHTLCPVCHVQDEKLDSVIIMEKDHPRNPLGRPLETTVKIIRDKQGQPMSILTMIHDLSHDRNIQEEKVKLEMQLYQAQKMEAIGQLAGGIAHDFNNMLTAIIGYGSLLNTQLGKDSELKPLVDQILSSAGKSADLTRQLLAFSRKQLIAPKETDLNELIKGMEKLLARLIGEDIELKTRLTEKTLTVMVDPGQIEQVLMNLSTNARDTMPDGGMLSIVTETAELYEDYVKGHDMEKPGMYALISVTDTGRGMDEKTQQKIFEPFFTTKEVGKGTGLGLSIVYGIIKQHGGNITVYSEPGKGTTFRIYLPLTESKIEEAKVTEIIRPKGGTETILLAEDNEDVRVLSKMVLEENGYTVIDAVDGEDAVNKFKEKKDIIQFVIIDVIMPKKSGKEAIDEIRKIKPDINILFTSGYTSDIISRKGILEEGMNFISKPVTPNDLLAKIRAIMDKEAQL